MKKHDDSKDIKTGQYSKVKRPTVSLSPEEHKLISKFCIDHEISIKDFMRNAALHCVHEKIVPDI